jgi:hypothetical protein
MAMQKASYCCPFFNKSKLHCTCFNIKGSCVANTTHEGRWVTLIATYSIHGDNQSWIVLSKTIKDHDHIKHIDIKYHNSREKVTSLEIKFKYCLIKQMIIDVLIKTPLKLKHQFCVEGIGLTIIHSKV